MAPSIDISPAVEEEFPVLAHIAAVAMGVDLVLQIIYQGNNPFDTSRQEQSIIADLRRAASNPEAHIYKAVLQSSREIVGYVMLRFEEDGQTGGPHARPSATSSVPGTNAKFMEHMMSKVRAVHSRHMAGTRHICQSLDSICSFSEHFDLSKLTVLLTGWTHLMVLPQFQRQGIGSALFQYGVEYLGADRVPIWLVTQMRGRAMYLTLGFRDVDVIDVDLSEYIGPWQGYGIHRNICMVRQPGGVASLESAAEITWS